MAKTKQDLEDDLRQAERRIIDLMGTSMARAWPPHRHLRSLGSTRQLNTRGLCRRQQIAAAVDQESGTDRSTIKHLERIDPDRARERIGPGQTADTAIAAQEDRRSGEGYR